MPKAKAKTKGVPTPPAERRRTVPESMTVKVPERPSTSAVPFGGVVIPSSSGLSCDVGEASSEVQPGTSSLEAWDDDYEDDIYSFSSGLPSSSELSSDILARCLDMLDIEVLEKLDMEAFHISMPKATAKSKNVPSPSEEKGCKGQESRSAEHAERPSASAASITGVVIPSSPGLSSDVGEVVPEAPQMDNPRWRAFIARFSEGVQREKNDCMEELCRSMKRYGLDDETMEYMLGVQLVKNVCMEELCRSMKRYGLDDETMEYMLDLTDDSVAPKDVFFVYTFLCWMNMIIATGLDPLRDRPSSVEEKLRERAALLNRMKGLSSDVGEVATAPQMDDPRWRAFIARYLEGIQIAKNASMEDMEQDQLELFATFEDILIRLGGIQDLTDDSVAPKDLLFVNQLWRWMEMLIATGFDLLRDCPISVEEKHREAADFLERMIALDTPMEVPHPWTSLEEDDLTPESMCTLIDIHHRCQASLKDIFLRLTTCKLMPPMERRNEKSQYPEEATEEDIGALYKAVHDKIVIGVEETMKKEESAEDDWKMDSTKYVNAGFTLYSQRALGMPERRLERRTASSEDVVFPSSIGLTSDVEDVPTKKPRLVDSEPWATIASTLKGEKLQCPDNAAKIEDFLSQLQDVVLPSSSGCSDVEDVPTMDPRMMDSEPWASIVSTLRDIGNNFDWLQKASPDQRKRMREYLLNLDASERANFDSERGKDICGGVGEIMKRIRQEIAKRDPRFEGFLQPMGSAENKTKIGDLNEFDYVLELITRTLLKEKGTFCRYGDSHIYVTFATEDDYKLCKPFVKERSDGPCDENTNNNITCILDTDNINEIFCDILNSVLQELELPPGWCHGGFNRTKFSGLRHNGKAHLLQFDYIGTDEKAPLRLSLDFLPMVRIPDDGSVDKLSLHGFIMEITGVKHFWVALERCSQHPVYSYAEEQWLTKYSSDEIPKTTMRICKVLGGLSKMNQKRLIPTAHLDKITNRQQENPGISSLTLSSDRAMLEFDTDEYVTYSDVGETVPDNSLVKSYAIKQIVMLMMMKSKCHGKTWAEDDLPDLVIYIFRILAGVSIVSADMFFCAQCEFAENKFTVPLKYNSEIDEDLKCSDKLETVTPPANFETVTPAANFDLEDAFFYILNKPQLLLDIHHYLDCADVSLLRQVSKLSGVFQLMRSVCEGHNTAVIFSHKAVPSKSDLDLCRYITKKEHQEMLANIDIDTLTDVDNAHRTDTACVDRMMP